MMGYVSHKRWINDARRHVDELAINPEYWLGRPLLEVLQTLTHEQCHVWQNHFGDPGRRSYHNREWADKMVSIGLMPSSTGRPGGKQTGEHMNDYVLSGGAFQKAAEELMATGFGLPWLDRSVAPGDQCVEIYDEAGVRAEVSASSDHALALATPIGAAFFDIKPAASSPEETEAVNDPILFEVAAKKPTRMKYRCEGCQNQAWGKPEMNLVCGDCDRSFVTVE
jgi:predicted SprT family Zn-dependent metalloprotease